MGHARAARHQPAHGGLRHRCKARGRGHRHARSLPVVPLLSAPRVTVYHAPGCSLCARALEIVAGVCGADFAAVDIAGDAELEARYRELLPVVEVDGERAFTYFVDAEGLRDRLERRRRFP